MQQQKQLENEEYTTIKVFKKDSLMLNQILSLLKMRGVQMNQSEFLHELLSFAFEREKQFFRELEQIRQMERAHQEMQRWMKIVMRRMQEL